MCRVGFAADGRLRPPLRNGHAQIQAFPGTPADSRSSPHGAGSGLFYAPRAARMSLAVVYSRAQDGIAAPLVACEVHLSGGLPGTAIVGLPETAVKEARDRVRAAILNAQLDYPQRRVTVNLAPADLPKDWCFHNYFGLFSNLTDDFINLWDESSLLGPAEPAGSLWLSYGETRPSSCRSQALASSSSARTSIS